MSTRADTPTPTPRRESVDDTTRLAHLGEVVSQILGDLDEPVTATRACLESCVRLIDAHPSIPAEIAQTAVRALAGAARADELLRRVRSFAHFDVAPQSGVSLNEIVRAAIAQCSAEIRSRNILLKLEVAEDLPALRLDADHIQQAVVSLIFNAVEAMSDSPADQRQLLVRTAAFGTTTAEIVVRDFGRGLPPDLGESIFDPHVSTRPSGLGLGLYISRQIVSAHGGRLWGRSAPPAGSEFRIELPLQQARPAPQAQPPDA